MRIVEHNTFHLAPFVWRANERLEQLEYELVDINKSHESRSLDITYFGSSSYWYYEEDAIPDNLRQQIEDLRSQEPRYKRLGYVGLDTYPCSLGEIIRSIDNLPITTMNPYADSPDRGYLDISVDAVKTVARLYEKSSPLSKATNKPNPEFGSVFLQILDEALSGELEDIVTPASLVDGIEMRRLVNVPSLGALAVELEKDESELTRLLGHYVGGLRHGDVAQKQELIYELTATSNVSDSIRDFINIST